jgi:adenylate cyclase
LRGQEAHEDEEVFASLAGAALGKELPEGSKRIQFSSQGAASYPPRSFYEVFTGELEEVEGKTVIIGSAAERFQDQHLTPRGLLYGPQLHLEMLAAARSDHFYREPKNGQRDWFLLGTFLSIFVVVLFRKPWLILFGCVASMGVLLMLAIVLTYYQTLSQVLMGLMVIAVILVISQVASLVGEGLRREQLRRQLRRSLSPNVAEAIIAAPGGYLDAARGGKREVAVLFSDIRNFTALSEFLEPAALVEQLNEYFAEMTEAVFLHEGTLDKFIGDGVMATWGGIREMTSRELAQRSLMSAEEMMTRLAKLNQSWKAKGRLTFEVGIGIHIGEAIAGEIGSRSRADFTVLGDAVNFASRIESFTRQADLPLLVSEALVSEGTMGMSSLGDFRLKGLRDAIGLFAHETMVPEGFRKALAALQGGDLEMARAEFTELKTDFALANLYLSQLDHWTGCVEVEEK